MREATYSFVRRRHKDLLNLTFPNCKLKVLTTAWHSLYKSVRDAIVKETVKMNRGKRTKTWTGSRTQQLEHRRSICKGFRITRFYFMLVIPQQAANDLCDLTRPSRNSGHAGLLWTVDRETFDPNCLPNPIKHPQTRFDCRMLMMLEISSFQSPLLVHKVHNSQGKTNRSLSCTSTRWNRNLLATALTRGSTNYDCYCETSNPKTNSEGPLLISSAQTHMDHTHIYCGLQALGAWISATWT